MTENHEYGPDLHDLNAGVRDEAVADKAKPSAPKPPTLEGNGAALRSEFYQKIRQDTPPGSEFSELVDLESEHGRKYDYD